MSPKFVGYRLAQWLSTRLPRSAAMTVAERLADVQWRCSAADRAAVRSNLRLVLGTTPPDGAPMVREVFRNFGRYLVDFFLSHRGDSFEIHVDGGDHLAFAKRPGHGVIVLTAHLGNWELGAVQIRRMDAPMSVVALPHDDPDLDRMFNRQRQRCGLAVIPLGASAARRSLQHLRAGGCLGILGDREFSGRGVAGRFGGVPVVFPRGPAVMSLRSRAPILPTFMIREGMGKFRFYLEPPIYPAHDAAPERAIERLTAAYASVIERYAKRFPEQWLVFQPLAARPGAGGRAGAGSGGAGSDGTIR